MIYSYKYSFPGGPYGKPRDSLMYRWEHDVGSFQLDGDNCECDSMLSASHAMFHVGFLIQEEKTVPHDHRLSSLASPVMTIGDHEVPFFLSHPYYTHNGHL